jgi:hypothetical protein
VSSQSSLPEIFKTLYRAGRENRVEIVEKNVVLRFAGEFFSVQLPKLISSVLSSITSRIFYLTLDPAWLPYETRIAKTHGDKL